MYVDWGNAQKLFFAFFRLGLTAFGGPAMVAYIRDLAVRNFGRDSIKKWQDVLIAIGAAAAVLIL